MPAQLIPTFSARSRFSRLPTVQPERLVFDTVSALISTSNQLRGVLPSATTVRQTPSQAIEAPMSMPAGS